MRFRTEATEHRSNSSRYCGVNNKGFCYQLGGLFYRVTLFLLSTLFVLKCRTHLVKFHMPLSVKGFLLTKRTTTLLPICFFDVCR